MSLACAEGLHLFQKEQSACLTGPVEALRHTGTYGGAEAGVLVGSEERGIVSGGW